MLFLDKINFTTNYTRMIRKIFGIFLFLTTISAFCLAQTDKGTWMLGGKGFIGSLGKGLYVNLEPNGGYFLYDNFAVGGLFKLQAATEANSTEFLARYYREGRRHRTSDKNLSV